MHFQQIKNLLPKRLTDGVALKTIVSEHQLSRLGDFRKLPRFIKLSKTTKLSLGGILALYLLGYQPALTMPPIQKSVVRAEFEQKEAIDATKLSQPFNLPHPGYLTTRFSSWHPGIDIATGYGMPVHPVIGGKVVEVIYGWFGLGHYVVVEHEQGFRSTYGHMGNIYVKKTDIVTSTSALGEVGMTGRTTGPHTHLEITKDGQYIDPQVVLPKISDWPQNIAVRPSGQGATVQKVNKPKPTITPSPLNRSLLDMKVAGFSLVAEPTPAPASRLPLPQL